MKQLLLEKTTLLRLSLQLLLVVMISSLLTSCVEKNITKEDKAIAKKEVKKGVYMYATAHDPRILDYINILDYASVTGRSYDDYSQQRIGDGVIL